MQVIELVGVILALSMEVMVGVILVQPLKATNGEKTAWLGSHRVIASRNRAYAFKRVSFSRNAEGYR